MWEGPEVSGASVMWKTAMAGNSAPVKVLPRIWMLRITESSLCREEEKVK